MPEVTERPSRRGRLKRLAAASLELAAKGGATARTRASSAPSAPMVPAAPAAPAAAGPPADSTADDRAPFTEHGELQPPQQQGDGAGDMRVLGDLSSAAELRDGRTMNHAGLQRARAAKRGQGSTARASGQAKAPEVARRVSPRLSVALPALPPSDSLSLQSVSEQSSPSGLTPAARSLRSTSPPGGADEGLFHIHDEVNTDASLTD